MKSALLIFGCLISFTLHSQELEFLGGMNRNIYFDYEEETPRFTSEYEKGNGIHFSFGFVGKEPGEREFPWNVYLSYDLYNGKIYTGGGGLGSFSSAKIKVKKEMIGVAIYLLNIKLFKKKFRINLGPELSFLINNRVEGSRFSTNILGENKYEEFTEDSKDAFYESRLSVNVKFKYEFQLSETLKIAPQYNFNYGLFREFKDFSVPITNKLHRFSIGVMKKIGGE